MNDPSRSLERRRILLRLWKGLGLVAGVELLAIAAAFFSPRKSGQQAGSIVVAGPASDFALGSVTPFPQARFYLVRLADGGFLALSSRCTHLGCTVPWSDKERAFVCPCHSSAFDVRGEVLSPPASRPLELFAVAIERGLVLVDTSRRVERSRFEPDQVAHL